MLFDLFKASDKIKSSHKSDFFSSVQNDYLPSYVRNIFWVTGMYIDSMIYDSTSF